MFKQIIAGILSLTLVVLCLGTVGESAAETEVRHNFTAEELLADYDQMWGILRESYPFLSLAGKSDAELEALLQENRALIGSRVQDAGGLYMLMQSTCRALYKAAYLWPLTPQEYREYHNWALQDEVDPDDYPFALDPQTVATYTQLGMEDERPLFTPPQSVGMEYFPDIRAAYFRFPNFHVNVNPEEPVPIADFLSEHPDVEHVIIDITGNSGGSVYYWKYHIVSAFSEPVSWKWTSYLRITELIASQYQGLDISPLPPEPPVKPGFVVGLGMTHMGTGSMAFPLEEYAGEQVDAPVRRWLLVDGYVAAGADTLAGFCKDTGWAAVVGETTRGRGLVLNSPVLARLDNTGLLFRFSVESGVNDDGTLNTERGTMPDYPNKPLESPLDACKRVILGDD